MRRLCLLVVLSGLTPQFAAAQEDAVQRGEAAFRMCGACHSVGEDAVNRMGPELNGVMGVPVATRPGFSYSESLSKLSADGVVWDHDTLAQFLRKPREFAPGTKMAFAGLADGGKVSDIIAYLATFSPGYVPAAAPAKD